MQRTAMALLLTVLMVGAATAQQSTSKEVIAQRELEVLSQAQMALAAAEQAGAPTLAKTLYDEASSRLRSAQAGRPLGLNQLG